jgi:hypothetical protein
MNTDKRKSRSKNQVHPWVNILKLPDSKFVLIRVNLRSSAAKKCKQTYASLMLVVQRKKRFSRKDQ